MRKAYLTVMIGILGTVLLGGCCSPRVIEKTVSLTDTLRTIDTVIVKVRPDTVRIEVPVSSQSVVTKDTASHLEDGLYCSDASWDGQFLRHSLNSKPGAVLERIVHHTDTIRIKEKAESHNRNIVRKETVYVQPTLKDKAGYVSIGFLIGIIISVIYGARKKVTGILKKLG